LQHIGRAGSDCRIDHDDRFGDQVGFGGFPDLPGSDRYAAANFVYVLAYFHLHSRPPVMDVDGDGVPCETLFPPSAISEVQAGGIILIRY